jgi:DNA polymerase
MVEEDANMGGTGVAIEEREAASALRWWLESGVDTPIQELPRNWLERAPPPPVPADTARPARSDPATLEELRSWLTGSEGPLASRSKPVAPSGSEGAQVMVLCEPPTRDEIASGEPVGGESAALLNRMLAAIGMADSAYLANIACFHSPRGRLTPDELKACGDAARRHVALAKPKRLLLLGDAPCQALLGKPLAQARGHVHKVEGVRAVATYHPRQLLKRTSDKALAWKDLLLLAEEPN